MTQFELWRQDDNGNRFLMSAHPDRETAEAALAAMEAGVQHKQLYYVVERAHQNADSSSDPSQTSRTGQASGAL
jgi:hypothetical protein